MKLEMINYEKIGTSSTSFSASDSPSIDAFGIWRVSNPE